MLSRKQAIRITAVAILVVYLVGFPSPTPRFAIRKDLLFTMHPILAFSAGIRKMSDDEYVVIEADRPFYLLKKTSLGWRVESAGTGP